MYTILMDIASENNSVYLMTISYSPGCVRSSDIDEHNQVCMDMYCGVYVFKRHTLQKK